MDNSHEKIKIDYGNNFRMIHGDIYNYTKELIKQRKLSFSDIGIWFYLCEYMKPYSTELDISISKFSAILNKSKGHISESINKLIKYNLIIQKDKKLYINLQYATRGNDIYKYVYDISQANFETKYEFNNVSIKKAEESEINYSKAF